MSDWYTWVFSGVGVAAMSALASYIKVKERFRRILFLERDQLDREIGPIGETFEKARESVYISGNDCARTAVSESPKIEQLLSRGVRVKILVVDPGSSAPEMLEKIDPRFPTAQFFRESMRNTLQCLRSFKSNHHDLFDYRLLPILPAIGFFIIDPHSNEGIVKIELYTAKEWKPIASRPHLIIKRKEKQWRNYFLHQWENYWTLGRQENS